jgi:hypothetical protein
MPVQQIPVDQASSSLGLEILERDGCVVLTGITAGPTRAELLRELEGYVPVDPYCHLFSALCGVESLQSISQTLRNRTVWGRLYDTVASVLLWLPLKWFSFTRGAGTRTATA